MSDDKGPDWCRVPLLELAVARSTREEKRRKARQAPTEARNKNTDGEIQPHKENQTMTQTNPGAQGAQQQDPWAIIAILQDQVAKLTAAQNQPAAAAPAAPATDPMAMMMMASMLGVPGGNPMMALMGMPAANPMKLFAAKQEVEQEGWLAGLRTKQALGALPATAPESLRHAVMARSLGVPYEARSTGQEAAERAFGITLGAVGGAAVGTLLVGGALGLLSWAFGGSSAPTVTSVAGV